MNYSKTKAGKKMTSENGIKSTTDELVINKRISTLKERYGVDNYSKTDNFKIQTKETSKERYGVDNYAKSEESKKNNSIANKERFLKNLSNDYELIEFGTNHKLKHKICNKEFTVDYKFFSCRKQRKQTICTECNPVHKHWSLSEKEILNFIKNNYKLGDIKENFRGLEWLKNPKTGKNLELDIYIPSLKLAIEFNGSYSHADNNKLKDTDKIYNRTVADIRYRDELKNNLCEENNTKLIQIKEKDWLNNKEIIKDCLISYLSR